MPEPITNVVERNVARVTELELELERSLSPLERRLHKVTRHVGTVRTIALHVSVIVLWCALNSGYVLAKPIDPPPFFGLVTVLAIEAILLTLTVLMTQNYMQVLEEHRTRLLLQVSLLTEQEATKMLDVLARVERRLGGEDRDEHLETLAQPTTPGDVINAITNLPTPSEK